MMSESPKEDLEQIIEWIEDYYALGVQHGAQALYTQVVEQAMTVINEALIDNEIAGKKWEQLGKQLYSLLPKK